MSHSTAMSVIGYLMLLTGWFGHQASSTRQVTMSNKHFKVGAVPYPPFLVINTDENGKAVYSGMIWDLIEFVQEARNCTFMVKIPDDLRWGNCHEIDNCTGMIGMVNRKEVDFALGPSLSHFAWSGHAK